VVVAAFVLLASLALVAAAPRADAGRARGFARSCARHWHPGCPVPTTTTAPDRTIGPDQHFVGLVNGTSAHAVITVVCPGPAIRPGAAALGQTLSVERVASGGGYTGDGGAGARTLWAELEGAPPVASFSSYGTAAPIPQTVPLPCEGSGSVSFTPCPADIDIPCPAGAVPFVVPVTFVNIAF
jgi:hypothetical protein